MREPKTYNEAVNDPIHGNRWREAVDEELWNLDAHQTWCYTPLPDNRKVIGFKWVFKVKYHPDGSIERYKARLVAQGFSQVHGIDYMETFAPTIRRESLRIFSAVTAMLGMTLIQIKRHWGISKERAWPERTANLYEDSSRVSSRLRGVSLQDTKELIRSKTSRKTLEQDNHQVFPKNWLHPHQCRRLYPYHQVKSRARNRGCVR